MDSSETLRWHDQDLREITAPPPNAQWHRWLCWFYAIEFLVCVYLRAAKTLLCSLAAFIISLHFATPLGPDPFPEELLNEIRSFLRQSYRALRETGSIQFGSDVRVQAEELSEVEFVGNLAGDHLIRQKVALALHCAPQLEDEFLVTFDTGKCPNSYLLSNYRLYAFYEPPESSEWTARAIELEEITEYCMRCDAYAVGLALRLASGEEIVLRGLERLPSEQLFRSLIVDCGGELIQPAAEA